MEGCSPLHTWKPREKKAQPFSRAFSLLMERSDHLPIFTSVTSKINAAFGGIGPFGCEP